MKKIEQKVFHYCLFNSSESAKSKRIQPSLGACLLLVRAQDCFLPEPGLGPHDAHSHQVDGQVEAPSVSKQESIFSELGTSAKSLLFFFFSTKSRISLKNAAL